jgi:hypothetical protein
MLAHSIAHKAKMDPGYQEMLPILSLVLCARGTSQEGRNPLPKVPG